MAKGSRDNHALASFGMILDGVGLFNHFTPTYLVPPSGAFVASWSM
jgi:hypothetical protein